MQGIIPICSYGRDIRDAKGFWQQLEADVQSRTEAHFSHGICVRCAEEDYPYLT